MSGQRNLVIYDEIRVLASLRRVLEAQQIENTFADPIDWPSVKYDHATVGIVVDDGAWYAERARS